MLVLLRIIRRQYNKDIAFLYHFIDSFTKRNVVFLCPFLVAYAAKRAVNFTISVCNHITAVGIFLKPFRIMVCMPFIKIIVDKAYLFHHITLRSHCSLTQMFYIRRPYNIWPPAIKYLVYSFTSSFLSEESYIACMSFAVIIAESI